MFANQMNSLLTGNDPLDMTKPTTWVQALLKGGSFGIYGDFLFQDHTQYGSSIAATIGGPAELCRAVNQAADHEPAEGSAG
jgi:hypothetical protein